MQHFVLDAPLFRGFHVSILLANAHFPTLRKHSCLPRSVFCIFLIILRAICHSKWNLMLSLDPHILNQLLKLQARLPDARVVYCSATGASEPRNMGYMVRLGLWGAGTCFADFQTFLGVINSDEFHVACLETISGARFIYLFFIYLLYVDWKS